jgi:hypothetical protein
MRLSAIGASWATALVGRDGTGKTLHTAPPDAMSVSRYISAFPMGIR